MEEEEKKEFSENLIYFIAFLISIATISYYGRKK